MGALVTVMVSPKLADGCDVAKDAVAALVADGWTPPAEETSRLHKMRHLVEAARKSVKDENWYAALTIALTFPDICASLASSDGRTNGSQYKAWVDEYLTPVYTSRVGPERKKHVFMTGGDCYALRCAFLHQGLDDIQGHKARGALTKFDFWAPWPNGVIVHRNQQDSRLQVQVDLFTLDMCDAVERWLTNTKGDAGIEERTGGLMRLMQPPADGSFSI